jgi:TonB family protein
MKLSKAIVAVCGMVLLTCTSALAADKREEGAVLLSHASQLTNLEREGNAPFLLRISWTALTPAGGPAQGKYVLHWASPDRWRKEISLANFTEVVVRGKDRVWSKRNLNAVPFAVAQLNLLVENLWNLAPTQEETIARVFGRSEHGLPLKCVELRTQDHGRRIVCVAPSGDIATANLSISERVYEFFEASPFGSRSFPRWMRVTQSGIPLIGAEVEDLASDNSPNELFSPPAGATERPTCSHPTFPKVVTKEAPIYPMSARDQHQQGSVTLFVVIETDGSLQNATVIQTAGKDLDEAALTAVKQWRYNPAMCANTPIPTETEITVNFALR